MVTGSLDRSARLWDASTGAELRRFVGHSEAVRAAGFSPDGTHLVTGSWDATAKVWDAGTGRELRSLAGHAGRVHAAAFSPDGTQVVTGGEDGTARSWSVSSGVEVGTFIIFTFPCFDLILLIIKHYHFEVGTLPGPGEPGHTGEVG